MNNMVVLLLLLAINSIELCGAENLLRQQESRRIAKATDELLWQQNQEERVALLSQAFKALPNNAPGTQAFGIDRIEKRLPKDIQKLIGSLIKPKVSKVVFFDPVDRVTSFFSARDFPVGLD